MNDEQTPNSDIPEPTPGPTMGGSPIVVPQGGLKVSWGLGFVGCLSALICVTAALFAPVLQSAGASMETQNCLSNLRRVSRALLLYADANGDLLPGGQWAEQLVSIEPDRLVYACPHQRRIDPRSSGYALNTAMAGKKLESVQNPGQVPMVFDSKATAPGAIADPADVPRPGRHKNGRLNNIAYADGHVASVDAN